MLRHSTIFLLFFFLAGATLRAEAPAPSERERKKREFLETPVFANTKRKQALEAQAKAAGGTIISAPQIERFEELRPLPAPKNLPEAPVRNAQSEQPFAPKSVPRTGPASTATRVPPKNLPAHLAARKDGMCGWDKWLLNYCSYKEPGGWLICSDRFAGCVSQEKR